MKMNVSKILATTLLGATIAVFTVGCTEDCCGVGVNLPTAVISPNFSVNGSSVTVSGATSHDKEDLTSLSKYEWFITDDLTKDNCTGLPVKATGVDATINDLEAGKDYKIFLKVTDKDGNIDCTSTSDSSTDDPAIIKVPENTVACEDKPAAEHANPTAKLDVYQRNSTTSISTMSLGGQYSLSCANSKDDCGASIPANGGQCEFNGASWLQAGNGECVKPAADDSTFYKEDCQLDNRFNPKNTPITSENMDTNLDLTACSAQNKFNCVEISVKVTDKYGHTTTERKLFKVDQ
jgi:hypothetical protein